jgi:hypothetical protein
MDITHDEPEGSITYHETDGLAALAQETVCANQSSFGLRRFSNLAPGAGLRSGAREPMRDR